MVSGQTNCGSVHAMRQLLVKYRARPSFMVSIVSILELYPWGNVVAQGQHISVWYIYHPGTSAVKILQCVDRFTIQSQKNTNFQD